MQGVASWRLDHENYPSNLFVFEQNFTKPHNTLSPRKLIFSYLLGNLNEFLTLSQLTYCHDVEIVFHSQFVISEAFVDGL